MLVYRPISGEMVISMSKEISKYFSLGIPISSQKRFLSLSTPLTTWRAQTKVISVCELPYTARRKGKLRRKISRCVMVTTLLLFGVLASSFVAHGVSPTRIYVHPPSIEDLSLVSGKTFSINVSIANVSDLSGYDFNMSYNTVILTWIGVLVGPLGNIPSSMWEIDDEKGNVWINVTYGTPLTTDSPETLASLTFLVQGRGSSVFDLYHTNLVNSLGQPIPHEVSNGYFVNGSPYDLNKDGHVNILDVIIVANAFGKKEGDPEWDPTADVNGDSVVNILDGILIAAHFGEI